MKQGVRNYRFFALTIALFGLLVSTSMLYSQSATSGAVVGTITDPTGAVVSGATVTLVQTSTNFTLKATTDKGGRYIFPSVTPGEYALTITAKGFRQTTVNQLVVQVNSSAAVDQVLTLGTTSEIVEVTASGMNELQTTDASVGEVLSGAELNRLPVQGRSAAQLIFYQPGVAPDMGMGDNTSGQIAGARSDQATFTIDGGDATSDLEGSNNYSGPSQDSSALSPVVPIPQDSIEEFKVATSNTNATFGNSSGGEISFVTKSGTNSFHGTGYEYHSDDGLDANGWTDNHNGVIRPHTTDNRFGAGLGGPIFKNKLFFYGFYEGRRFHDSTLVDRLVPTAAFKSGEIGWTDANNVVHEENFNPANGALSTDCPAANGFGGACDPRAIGASSVSLAQLALLPTGNNINEGDGVNTIGLTEPGKTPISLNMGKLKLNGTINNKWSATGTWQYASTARTGDEQFSLLTGAPVSVSGDPYFSNFFTIQVQGQLSPTFLSVTHGSFLKNWWGWSRQAPSPLVSGTDYAIQMAGEGTGASSGFTPNGGKLISDPININTQQARSRVWDGHDWYIAQDFTKILGAHTWMFGGDGRIWYDYHIRTDQVLGGLTTGPIDYVQTGGLGEGTQNVSVGGNFEPVGIPSSSAAIWDGYYAALMGMVDHSAQVEVRNGSFQPYALGTPTAAHTTLPAFNLYFQDLWKARRNLTLTLGINWGVTLIPHEKNGLQANLVYADSNTPLDAIQYLDTRSAALEAGGSYNPTIGISPVGSLAQPWKNNMRQAFWKNIGPHFAVAWEVRPNTVIRGGYSLVWDRSSAVNSVLSGLLAGGLADVDTCAGPTFNGSGVGQCQSPGVTTDPTSAFRLGHDGASVPIPAPVADPIPFVPANGFGLTRSYGADAYYTPGYAHVLDLTVQHTLPYKMLLEVGYMGRFSRNLTNDEELNSPDLKQMDAASGQRYATAFDAVSNAWLACTPGPCPTIPNQPFFENNGNPAVCTPNGTPGPSGTSCTGFAQFLMNNIIQLQGNIWFLDAYMNLFGAYANPTTNTQVELLQQVTHGGWSNYNAGFVSLRSPMSHGLQYQFNWTYSKALGNQGLNQQYIYSNNDPYNYNVDYGAEPFDHKHTITALWYYELPFGKGKAFNTSSGVVDRIIGGWNYSGIFNFFSGSPQCAGNLDGTYGSLANINAPCAVPSAGLPGWSKNNISGSENVFANPSAVLASLSYPQVSAALAPNFHNSVDQMRTFAFWNFDMSLGKNIPITERVALRFSADAFNVLNHVIFQNPAVTNDGMDISNPAEFGVITQQFGAGINASTFGQGARILQVGARVEF